MSISLDKEWYTINETSEILGVSTTVIWNRINKLKSSLINIKETEYKMERRKYLIHRDYINRCMEETSKKEWYSINETCKIIGISERWLYARIRNGSIPASERFNSL
ncbi:helix-turn-helix transcriptional regulator [Peribacillus simplex]|uniref:helix-turn-helix transcriptional regulator n=1 Tax=Peribacillus simplex TaxID=1478 RepID=UPI003D28BC14